MQGLMLHCGAETVTRESLAAIPAPEKTATYCPIPHLDMLDLVLEGFDRQLPVRVERVEVGMTREGARMFGVARFEATEGADWGISVGFRNSYDQSMAAGLSVGASVFVCDNLCFSGSSATYLRRHTPNVWRDLIEQIGVQAAAAWAQFGEMDADLTSFQGLEMAQDAAFAALGVMLGRGILRPRQFTQAVAYLQRPPHEEHALGDLFGWYQAINHALKGSDPTRVLGAHAGLHQMALDLRDCGGDVWSLDPAAAALRDTTVSVAFE